LDISFPNLEYSDAVIYASLGIKLAHSKRFELLIHNENFTSTPLSLISYRAGLTDGIVRVTDIFVCDFNVSRVDLRHGALLRGTTACSRGRQREGSKGNATIELAYCLVISWLNRCLHTCAHSMGSAAVETSSKFKE